MSAAFTPLDPALHGRFDWTRAPAIAKIVGALLRANPGSARFVGGCVRDSLLGASPKDVDIATTLRPAEVVAALDAAGLRSAPTGVEHGTITAIADHVGVEVTTLRADVSTDGRRATVAFTQDWSADAGRRDFTINALYLTPDFKLFDPVGGLADLRAGRVRFIGDADRRLDEDYLRLLRFFRFSARFAAVFDKDGLDACRRKKDGLRILSAERIGDEFTKILELPSPQAALSAMAAIGVLFEIWPHEASLEILARLKAIAPAAPAPLGLAALWGAKGEGVDARLRLSNAQGQRRRDALRWAEEIDPSMDDRRARAALYRAGREAYLNACLLASARAAAVSDAPDGEDPRFIALRQLPERWTAPPSPFSGRVAIERGLPEGPAIKAAIAAAEARWIDEDFPDQERAAAIFREEIDRLIAKG